MARPPTLTAAELSGFLTGPDNIPISEAKITLTDENAHSRFLRSSGQGSFAFEGLGAGNYTLAVEADGYADSVPRTIVIKKEEESIRLSVRLRPTNSEVGRVTALASQPPPDALLFHTWGGDWASILSDEASSLSLLKHTPGYHSDLLVPAYDRPNATGAGFHHGGLGENLYRLDGMNITDPVTGQSSFDFPLEFLERLDVSTAGLSAEQSGQTGAVVSQQCKYGSNALHGDFFLYATPYRQPNQPQKELSGSTVISRSDRFLASGMVGFDLSGALVPDRLWFFIGVGPGLEFGETTRTFGDLEESWDQAQWNLPMVGRITLNLTPEQMIQFSAYGKAQGSWGVIREATDTHTGLNGEPSTFLGTRLEQSLAVSGRYAHRLPRLRSRIDFQLGYLRDVRELTPDAPDFDLDGEPDDISAVLHSGTYFLPDAQCFGEQGCWVEEYQTGGWGAIDNASNQRLELQLTGLHRIRQLLGGHALGWGGNLTADQLDHTHDFTGGTFIREYEEEATSTFEYNYYLSPDMNDIAPRDYTTSVNSLHFGGYLRDRWSPVSNLEVDISTRIDTQRISNEQSATSTLAPAVSPKAAIKSSYSLLEGGSIVLSYGRSSSQLPLWIVDAALATPRVTTAVYSQSPERHQSDSSYISYNYATPSKQYAVSPSLSLPSQNEIFASVRQSVTSGFSATLSLFANSIRAAIAPLRYPGGLTILANPGESPGTIAGDYYQACFWDTHPLTGETTNFCYEPAQRNYRAAQLSIDRTPASDQGFWLRLAYTLSNLSGDYPGPTPQELGTEPSDLLSLYNLLNLDGAGGNGNRFGPLPTDHRHRVALDTRLLFFGFSAGLAIQASSGAPLDVYGLNAASTGTTFVLPRGAGGRGAWIIEQELSLGYRVRLRATRYLTLEATVTNPLQLDAGTRYDKRYVLSPAHPAELTSIDSETKEQISCYDPATYSVTDCTWNSFFGTALEAQSSTALRLAVRYHF